MPVLDLQFFESKVSGSGIYVQCKCDRCKGDFKNQIRRISNPLETLCRSCKISKNKLGNNHGSVNRGQVRHSMMRDKNPKWNPNKAEFDRYRNEVHYHTRKQPLELLENFEKPRGRMGTPGAYQIDHIISIKKGFQMGLPAKTIGSIANLQIIPWEQNLEKGEF